MAYETEKEMNDNYPIIKEKWTKILNDIFPGSFQDIGISYCNRYKSKVSKTNEKANKHYFVSIHFVVNSHFIELKHFEKFNKDNGFEEYEEYDKTVYSNGQNFRMIGQSKPDGNGEFCFEPSPMGFKARAGVLYVEMVLNQYAVMRRSIEQVC